jgi:hypothetical protein
MASVTVFVDEAVQGRFPGICASSGALADRKLRFEQRIGGSSPALLLLVFLGPVGWLLLLLLSQRGERLEILLPVSNEVTERWRRLKLYRRIAVGTLALAMLNLLLNGPSLTSLVLFNASWVWVLTCQARVVFGGIGIHLDASRRWVTLKGVHKSFAASVRAQQTNRA